MQAPTSDVPDATSPSVPADPATAPDDSKLIAKFTRDVKIPNRLDKWYRSFARDTAYVNDECMSLDAEDAVGTNHILRNQYILSSQLYARDPELGFQPSPHLIFPDVPPTIAPGQPGMPPTIIPGKPGEPPRYLVDFGNTMTAVVKHAFVENRFRQRLRGAIQDVETHCLIWFKINIQEDYTKDPLGLKRFNDQQDNYALLKSLLLRQADGEFDADSADGRRLADLQKTCAQYMIADLQKQMAQSPMPQSTPGAPMAPGAGGLSAALSGAPAAPVPPAGAPAQPGAPDLSEAGEDPAEEATESPADEAAEQSLSGAPAQQPDAALAQPPGSPGPQAPGMGGAPVPPVDPRQAKIDQLSSANPGITADMIPEIPRFIGFPIEVVNPDDIRIDWALTRFEDFYDSRYLHHRVFMDPEAFMAKYKLSAEEMKLVPRYKGTTPNDDLPPDVDTGDRGLLDSETDPHGRVAVWERWDKMLNRVYVFVTGYKKLLDNYVPEVTWRNWFPFVPLMFNRVTGRFFGVSSTTLQRPAQEEINLHRSHDRHAKKASFPRILVKKGLFKKGEKQKYQNSRPYEVIELEAPDEIMKYLYETKPVAYDPQLYDTTKAEFDLQRMAGVSTVSGGAVGGADSATEVATAQQGTDKMGDFKRGLLEDAILDVGIAIADMALQVYPLENVIKIAGPGAVWPTISDRQDLFRYLNLEIKAGSMGPPNTDQKLKWLQQMVGMAQPLGLQANGPEILGEMARDAGIGIDFSRFFRPMAPMAPPPGAGQPAAGAPPKPNMPAGPDSQQGQGGGAPPMGDRPLPTPQQIPNHPKIPA